MIFDLRVCDPGVGPGRGRERAWSEEAARAHAVYADLRPALPPTVPDAEQVHRVCAKTTWHLAKEIMSARGLGARDQSALLSVVMTAVAPRVVAGFARALVFDSALPPEDAEGVVCTVCQCEVRNTAGVTLARCGHVFHGACVCEWFMRTSGSSVCCPVCRDRVTF